VTAAEPIDERSAPADAQVMSPHEPWRAEVAAFYLPQYHRIPENDDWWGEGFTDWENLRRSRPFFAGHRQPQLPGALGYYDLTDPEVHYRQHELARTFGVSAFCYYAYWFTGRRLLEQPLDLILRERALPTRYFMCWANENWTRTWDGLESHVLMDQRHDADSDADIINDLGEHLCDDRYVRLDGHPILLIYRTSILDEPLRTTDLLRERASKLGIGELHLAMVQSFGSWDPRPHGFDSAIEFPPHGNSSRLHLLAEGDPARPAVTDPESWVGSIHSYPRLVEWAMSKPVPEFTWFRGVTPSWDNTPRRLERASAITGDSPDLFQTWLERALHYTYLFHEPGRRWLFINAWNEWCEGAYLEPDYELGTARLEAVARALRNTDALAAGSGKAMTGDSNGLALVEVARAYFRSTAVLGREALSLWFAS
jgi:Glycosyltransferase WbsX